MDMTTAAAISPIPTLQTFTESGGKPEEYNAFVEKRTAELEAEAFKAAGERAGGVVRVRVVGSGWRPGQTHYKVLAKAPFDPRIEPGKPGYENPYKHEPPLSLRIGAVTEVPIRDERHLALLKSDANLKFEGDGVPTHEEEQALVDAARKHLAGGGASAVQVNVSALEAFKKELAQVKEEALKAIGDARAEATAAKGSAEKSAAAQKVAEESVAKLGQDLEATRKMVADLQVELAEAKKKLAAAPPPVPADGQGQQGKKK